MSIKDDLDAAIEGWAKFTLFSKIVIVLTIMGQVLSLASIGDEIFEFRGFVVEMIHFYHDITLPLMVWINSFNYFYITQLSFDAIVISVLFFSSVTRGDILLGKGLDGGMVACFILMMYILMTNSSEINVKYVVFLLVIFGITLIFTYWHISKISFDEQNSQIRRLKFNIANYFAPLIILFLTIVVSEGVFRSLE